MNNPFNKIIDVVTSFASRLSVLLIILVLGLIIFSRLDKLFNMNIIDDNIPSAENLILSNKDKDYGNETDKPALIVYEGNIKPEDSLSIKSKKEESEKPDDIVAFEIYEDQSPREVATTLKDKGLIQDIETFIVLLEGSNLLERIIPGTYNLPKNIKNMELIESITIPPTNEEEVMEEIEYISFEISEVDTPNDVAKILLDKGFIQDPPSFIKLLEENNLLEKIIPGIYKLPKDIKNQELIETITEAHTEN